MSIKPSKAFEIMLSPIPLLGMAAHACNPSALGDFQSWDHRQGFWANLATEAIRRCSVRPDAPAPQ